MSESKSDRTFIACTRNLTVGAFALIHFGYFATAASANDSERVMCRETSATQTHWNPELTDINGIWSDGSGTGNLTFYFSKDFSVVVIPAMLPTVMQMKVVDDDWAHDRLTLKAWNISPLANVTGQLPKIAEPQLSELRALNDEEITQKLPSLNSMTPAQRYEFFHDRQRVLRHVSENTEVAIRQDLARAGNTDAEKAYKEKSVAGYRAEIAANTKVLEGLSVILAEIERSDPTVDSSPQHETMQLVLQRRWDKAHSTFRLTVINDAGTTVQFGYVRRLLDNETKGLLSATAIMQKACAAYAPSGQAPAAQDRPDGDTPPQLSPAPSTDQQPKPIPRKRVKI